MSGNATERAGGWYEPSPAANPAVIPVDVDHVYTWVNDRDETLSAARSAHGGEVRGDAEYKIGASRIADHGELRASIRNARKYLPFVRNTYIFGAGRPPEWLSEFGSSVIYVPQGDVIPGSIWPSFQSDIAEAFIHQIPGLSERYIYSNDDFFFAATHGVDDFFLPDGKARIGLSNWPAASGPPGTFRQIETNGVQALQQRFALTPYAGRFAPIGSACGLRERLKFVRRLYRLARSRSRLVNGISHVSQPYLRSEWAGFHRTFEPELTRLFATRFRSGDGIGVNFVYHHYLHAIGKAVFYDPGEQDWLLNRDDVNNRAELRFAILRPASPVRRFCLNDAPAAADDGWPDYIRRLLADMETRGG